MKVLRHQHPAEQAQTLLVAKRAEGSDKVPAEALRIKQPGAAVSAGSDEMPVIICVSVPLARHGAVLHPEIAHIAKPRYMMRHLRITRRNAELKTREQR